jgi:hypothetical protein
MSPKSKNKVGAPKGNQNARKHGFYSKILAPRQHELLASVIPSDSLDQEIAVMRMKIASIIAEDPDNTPALVLAVTTLARLLRVKKDLNLSDIRDLKTVSRVVSRLFSRNNRA